jgi:cell division septal protein FtsQ
MTAPTVDRPVVSAPVLAPGRRRRRWLRFAVIAVAVVVVGAVVWAVWFSTLLAAAQVRVVGVEGARTDAVLAAAAVPVGVPLARVDTARAERAVLGLPWVLDAEVRRGWPSEIVVAVSARVPIAAIGVGPGRSGVDAEGVVFPVAGALPKGLPTVTAEGVALTEAMAALATLPPDLARKVVSVSATTRDDIELTLRSGDRVRWGSSDQPEVKATVLRALMNRKADIYDVAAPELPTTFRAR